MLNFGSLGFVSLDTKFINISQIKSIKFFINRYLKLKNFKKYKLWDLTNFSYPCFQKSKHARMGKGKGKFLEFKYYVKRGSIIFEFDNISKILFKNLYNFLRKKVSFRIKLVSRI
jgi:ribosomal protein L16/L10AE